MRLSLSEARTILGDDVLAPEEVTHTFGVASASELETGIPFTPDDLARARGHGMMLVWRAARVREGAPLTILKMLEQHPQAFDPKLLRQAGYQLKDEWGIAVEPLAATETCAAGWGLVRKQVLEDSCNLAYEEQDPVLRHFAASLGVPHTAVRRRTAAECVYDTVLYCQARRVRLLEQTWDWSSSATVDGGYLNVGGFSASGMQILSFSRAVRHGRLGICPTYQPTI